MSENSAEEQIISAYMNKARDSRSQYENKWETEEEQEIPMINRGMPLSIQRNTIVTEKGKTIRIIHLKRGRKTVSFDIEAGFIIAEFIKRLSKDFIPEDCKVE